MLHAQLQAGMNGKPIEASADVQKHAKHVVDAVQREVRNRKTEKLTKWAVWEKQFEGRLELPEVIAQDINLDIPLTREFIKQLIARLINPVFQFSDRLFVARPRTPAFAADARTAEEVFDYIIDQSLLYDTAAKWAENAMVYPFGVAKVRFIPPHITKVKRRNEFGEIVEEDLRTEDARAVVEPVPPIHFFASRGAPSLEEAEWISHRVAVPSEKVKAAITRGEYANPGDKLEKADASADTPPMFAVEELNPGDKLNDESEWFHLMETYFTHHDKAGQPHEYLMVFEYDSGQILMLKENPFFDYPRPFVMFYYEEITGSIEGKSAAQSLEPIHRAYAASVNLRLISAAKANNVGVFVPKGAGVKNFFANGVVRPGVWELDVPPGGKISDIVSTFNLSQPFSHLPQLEGLLMEHAQKLLSLSDYSFGVEQIQRPTALGQSQLINEGKQALYSLLERFRRALGKVAEIMMARYMQYFPDGLTLYLNTMDNESRMRTLQLSQWPEGLWKRQVLFEPRVSSQSLNKDMRKQEKLSFAEKLPEVYQFLMTLASQAAQPSPMAGVAQKLLTGYTSAAAQWMEEFEIENLPVVLPDLSQDTHAVQNVLAFFQQLAQRQQAAAAGPGAMAAPPQGVPGGPGGPGMAPPAAPGAGPPGMAPPTEGPPSG